METQDEFIKYNYYPIDCINIRNVDETIVATYQGKINEPNIMLKKGNEIINYQAKELRLCNKLHEITEKQDGEIMIIHSPTTSSMKLYVCFPFVYKNNVNITDIDEIFFSDKTEQTISLEMNKYINVLPKVRIYETYDIYGEMCRVLVFEQMIYINHQMPFIKSQNILELDEIDKIYLNYPFLAKAKSYQESISLESKLRSSSFLFGENGNNDKHNSLLFNEITKNPIQEGMETINGEDDVIYSCEYLPIDSEDMVQVLQVPIGSPGYSNLIGNEVSNLFINHGIFMFIVILFFFITPLIYNFFYSKISENEGYRLFFLQRIDWTMFRGTNMNIYNIILLLIIFITTLFLLIWGFGFGNSTASSIGLFLPFSSFIGYLGISFFYKNSITQPILPSLPSLPSLP